MTNQNTTAADLKGPLTESQFLQALENSYETSVSFAYRAQSSRASNSLSYLGSGYIVAQANEFGVLLYDSVQNPEAYMSRLPGRCWLAGRHQIDQYYLVDPRQRARL